MKVLVACEESQEVCKAFRARGHEAYSCDIQECSGGHPEWHIQADVLPILGWGCEIVTADGQSHTIEGKWDLIIAHPPCTYLSNAGAARLFRNVHDGDFQMVNIPRLKNGILARDFFFQFLNADCDRVAVENPVPSRIYMMPKASQTIQPYEYGHPYQKKTMLWLKGLPNLVPTDILSGNFISLASGGSKKKDGTPRGQSGTKLRSSRDRSKTFSGIAKAMAEQWG